MIRRNLAEVLKTGDGSTLCHFLIMKKKGLSALLGRKGKRVDLFMA
jgi:hypothetical protein